MLFNRKVFILLVSCLLFIYPVFGAPAVEPPGQQISDFSLVGYEDKGKKSWDISGKSADIFTEVVKLKDVNGNLYGANENVNLTAKKGDFNKEEGKVYLKEDVIITTSSGAKLTTDSMDWDRKNQLVRTEDKVKINKDNIDIVGTGAYGEPNLNKVALNKDVRVDINQASLTESADDSVFKDKVVITCDGPLEVDYSKNIATFNNNVKVERADLVIYSDKMDIFFNAENKAAKEAIHMQESMAGSIDKIIAKGNVRIVRGDNVSYSQEAIYTAKDKKIILNGRPQLVFYSTEEFKDASFGN
ncbi:MAG: LPS export ABC transporter periplasmic protein LptC [Candidatus Omnitrophica bacterium]|nr:LPS export ABC transporter periplasmic protein LptC [Candidatus Omnitrophota bacterium]